MEIQRFINSVITTIISLIIFYIVKNFWPKYFEEKGKNQATKEDIGVITTIIENIKSNLNQQNEFLKAELSITNQHKLNLKNAEREAIFDYNKKVSAWIYSLLRFSFSGYYFENYKDLKLMSIELSKRQYECDLAEAHLTLFMYDPKFLELKRDLTISVIKFESIVEEAIRNYYYTCLKTELEIQNKVPIEQSKLREKLFEELTTISKEYDRVCTDHFLIVHNYQAKLTMLINERIKLINETGIMLANS